MTPERPESENPTMAELASSIDAAMTGPHFMSAPRPIQDRLRADSEARRWLFPLDYRATWEDGDAEAEYEPVFLSSGGVEYPPSLDTIDPTLFSDWARLSELLHESAAIARYEDLLWVVRHGDRADLHARRAVEAYLNAASQDRWFSVNRVAWLARALHIARSLRDGAVVSEVRERIEQEVIASLDDKDPKPGVTLRLLKPLVSLPVAGRPSGLSPLIDRAVSTYAANVWIVQDLLQLKMELAGGDAREIERLRRETVRRWIAEADQVGSEGLQRHFHLDEALQLASHYGYRDLEGSIVAMMQTIPHDELGLTRVSVTQDIDRAEINRLIAEITEPSDWDGVIERIAALGPLTGDPSSRLEAARAQMAETPFLALTNPVILGPHGLPLHRVSSDDEKLEWQRVQAEALSLHLWGTWIGEAIEAASSKIGSPGSDVSRAFESPAIPPSRAAKIATALSHFSRGDYDESVLVILPRIEAALRDLAFGAGVAIGVPPRGLSPGRLRTLGELLRDDLKGVLFEPIRRHLDVLLTHTLGLNLRNVHLHGLAEEGDRISAALLLHAAALISRLRPAEPLAQPGPLEA